jgi:hypothetical protein
MPQHMWLNPAIPRMRKHDHCITGRLQISVYTTKQQNTCIGQMNLASVLIERDLSFKLKLGPIPLVYVIPVHSTLMHPVQIA